MHLFLQIICSREVKRGVLNLKVSAEKWRVETETVAIPPDSVNKRIGELTLLKFIKSQKELLKKIRQVLQRVLESYAY